MSQAINLCKDSDDNGDCPNTASVPSPPLSRKRPRKKDACSENDQVVDHREPHDGIVVTVEVAIAASQSMNSDSEQTSRNDGSANKDSHKLSTSKPPPNALGRRLKVSTCTWNDRLSELADFRKIHGHCNVPKGNSENPKLGTWARNQRSSYKLHVKGKRSAMTPFRIQELESLGFEWSVCVTTWEDRLSELADYRKTHGHCNVPSKYSENPKLGGWVADQRRSHKLHLEGKTSYMTPFRIQELESLGFEWKLGCGKWTRKKRSRDDKDEWPNTAPVPSLSFSRKSSREKETGNEDAQLADHRECHDGVAAAAASQSMNSDSEQTSRNDGSANMDSHEVSTSKPPSNASERRLKVSTWNESLSELADYRKIHGNCNIRKGNSENPKLARWVKTQRGDYGLHAKGKKSPMTTSRIQELDSLGFEWDTYGAAWECRLSELADYLKEHGHCNVPQHYSENAKLGKWVGVQRKDYGKLAKGKKSPMTTFRIQKLESLGFEWNLSHGLVSAWNDRLSELADYRKIHGHCNVPRDNSEDAKLASWVGKQRCNYKLHLEGKSSGMTPFRIQELESLGFEWKPGRGKGTRKKRSRKDNDEWPNTAHVPSLPLSRKRPREKDVGNEDAQVADNREYHDGDAAAAAIAASQSINSDSEQTSRNDGSANRDSHEVSTSKPPSNASGRRLKVSAWNDRIAVAVAAAIAASQSMNSETEQTSQNDGSANKDSHQLSTSKPPPNASGRRLKVSAWNDRLSELADYRKIHGHCNVPRDISENPKLGGWVADLKRSHKLQLEGKSSPMTPFRIQELESLGFEWKLSPGPGKGTSKKSSLDNDEMANTTSVPSLPLSRKILRDQDVGNEDAQVVDHREYDGIAVAVEAGIAASQSMNSETEQTSQNDGSANKDSHQRSTSKPPPNASGRRLKVSTCTWNDRLSELADFRKIHGHCNVPKGNSENPKLGTWARSQRSSYKLHVKGKRSAMTPFRIQELESLGFEWSVCVTTWEDRLTV